MDKKQILQVTLGVLMIGAGGYFIFAPTPPPPKETAKNETEIKAEVEPNSDSNIDIVQNQSSLEKEKIVGEKPVDSVVKQQVSERIAPNQAPKPKTTDIDQQTEIESKTEKQDIQSSDIKPEKTQEQKSKEENTEVQALIKHIQKLESELTKQNKIKKEKENQQKEIDLLKKQIAQLEKATTIKDKENKLLKDQLAKLDDLENELADKKAVTQVTNNHITLNIKGEVDDELLHKLDDEESGDIVADLNNLEDGETLEITDEYNGAIWILTKIGDTIIDVKEKETEDEEGEIEENETDENSEDSIEEDSEEEEEGTVISP